MKIIPNRTLYACDHCGKRYQIKSACLYHEQHKCYRNPNNQHICFDNCKFFKQIEEETTQSNYDGSEYQFKYKTFWCEKHHQEMYSYRINDKHFLKPFIGGVRMPLDCSKYEIITDQEQLDKIFNF